MREAMPARPSAKPEGWPSLRPARCDAAQW